MIVQEHEINSTVIDCYEYRKIYAPIVRETLQCQMEPENIADKYAVAVIKKSKAVGPLMNDKSGKFVKTLLSS